MCCQMTPAIGIEPMKPMTTMRFRFMERKWKEEGKRPTSNVNVQHSTKGRQTGTSDSSVER